MPYSFKLKVIILQWALRGFFRVKNVFDDYVFYAIYYIYRLNKNTTNDSILYILWHFHSSGFLEPCCVLLMTFSYLLITSYKSAFPIFASCLLLFYFRCYRKWPLVVMRGLCFCLRDNFIRFDTHNTAVFNYNVCRMNFHFGFYIELIYWISAPLRLCIYMLSFFFSWGIESGNGNYVYWSFAFVHASFDYFIVISDFGSNAT